MAEQRIRRKHNKVRTGCLTCKIRRKKCDETYPSCARCTETGRKCDGYGPIMTAKSGVVNNDVKRSHLTSTPNPAPAPSAALVKKVSNPNCEILYSTRTDYGRSKDGAGRILRPNTFTFSVTYSAPIETYDGLLAQDEKRHRRCQTVRKDMGLPPSVLLQESFDHKPSRLIETHPTQAELVLSLLRAPNPLAELPRISDFESHCVSYFRHFTVPRLTSYFECSLWRTDLVRGAIAVAHPVLFYCVTALGAVHRRFSLGITPEAFEYCRHAANLYNRAVRALDRVKQSFHGQLGSFGAPAGNAAFGTTNLIATSEVLLGIFQGFQTEYSASWKHLATGVKYAIGPPLNIVHSETRYCTHPAKPRTICRMMYSLYCGVTQIFDSPIQFLGWDPFQAPAKCSIPEVFEGLEDMRDHLFTIVESVWRNRSQAWDDPEMCWPASEAHEMLLQEWTSATMQTITTSNMMQEPWQREAFSLLHMTRSMAYLVIYANTAPKSLQEIGSMPHLPIFPVENQSEDLADAACLIANAVERFRLQGVKASQSEVKGAIQKVMDNYQILRFGEETSSGPSCSITDNYRRSDADADAVFEQKSNSRDVTEMLGLISIARRISEIEEWAAIELIRGIIPPYADITYVDIASIYMDERKVSVRYYVPHSSGEGFVWNRELWSF